MHMPTFEKMRRRAMPPQVDHMIVIVRMLVLQSLYNLSDEQVEYRVRDRLRSALSIFSMAASVLPNVVGAFDHFESLFRRTKKNGALRQWIKIEAVDQRSIFERLPPPCSGNASPSTLICTSRMERSAGRYVLAQCP